MGKKKPIRNPFFCFAMELKSRNPQRFSSTEQAFAEAGKLWEQMTPDEKLPYQEKSRRLKEDAKGQDVKYTTLGIRVDTIEKIETEKRNKVHQMKENIEEDVRRAAITGRIAEEMFFMIHMNYFCQYIERHVTRYLPAEIALCKFSLRSGVVAENIFHRIIKPGRLPLGYSCAAKTHSQETHQLPPPLCTTNGTNFDEVVDGLLTFIEECDPSKIILYALDDEVEKIQSMIDMLFCETDSRLKIEIYSVEYLLYQLKNNVTDKTVWPTLTISLSLFEKDTFAYCSEITCDYHQECAVSIYCSRSRVIRAAYMICDCCCVDLGISLIPGIHVPIRAKLKKDVMFRAKSSMSVGTTSNTDSELVDFPDRCDSRLSAFSATTTMTDPNDVDFDRGSVQSNADDFYADSYSSQPSRNASQNSTGSFQKSRRPVTLSSGLTGSSMENRPSSSGVGRGALSRRGRGIAASFSKEFA